MGARWNRYWFEFTVERSRLVALRILVFGLLAWDLWTTFIPHAPRYGAGGVNATQFAWLDAIAPVPTPAAVGALWLLTGFLALRCALGVATRTSAVLIAVLFSWSYLWSQADSYQHHYFVCLALTLFALLPTGALRTDRGLYGDAPPPPDDGETPLPPGKVRHFGVRMLYVQLAILYGWTAFTKLDATWLDGHTIASLLGKPELREAVLSAGARFGLAPDQVYPAIAWATMFGEFFAALVFLVRPLWGLGLVTVPFFHLFVEFTEFDIEYFSYYMIAFDVVLLCPSRLWNAVAARLVRLAAPLAGLWRRVTSPHPLPRPAHATLAVVVAVAVGVIVARVPIEGTRDAGIVAGLLALAAGLLPWGRGPRRPVAVAAGQLLALGGMCFALAHGEVAFDYYRMWGGDLKRRGDLEASALAYERANAVSDGPARLQQLGDVYARLGRHDEAHTAWLEARARNERLLTTLLTAQNRAPNDAERRFDTGETQLRLASACSALARSHTRRGESEAAAAASRCAEQSQRDAAESFTTGLRFAPNDARGFTGLRQSRPRGR